MTDHVRPFGPGDVAAAAALEARVFPDPWPAAAFRDLLEQAHVCALALEDAGGGLAGYAVGSRAADEGEVLNLAVDGVARGRGLGRALLEALVAELRRRGAASIYLEVRRSNAAAIRLYERVGFVPAGSRRGYYRNPREDALTMVLKVEGG